ncbi:cystatin-B-like [Alligator sinensis]|uniref:Cystatin-B-like n=1 Tax=Alligator sinensis TaxID=38654 RepID=A0A3Q0FQ00_ALLSI|nr:cystatin-B-like [Alligator sinensis]
MGQVGYSSWSPDFYILNNLLLFQVKSQVEEKEGKNFDVFAAVEFKTQVVAGMNYFIKVHVGNDEFLHLRVFKSLPHENKPLSLSSYQKCKTKHDELTYF